MTCIETYWSMRQLADNMSSGCLSCSFLEDVVIISFLTSILLSVIFSLLFFIKRFFLKTVIQLLLLIIMWLFWNYSIFVDRESSWSTYDTKSEIYYTISMSIFPVSLLGCFCILLLHYKKIKAGFIPHQK
ncbi:hypothetical protein C1631_022160 [Chryseobacterium phosphatilyticum]|uniref:Uncharacterized protein n=1 Tax=Chryseobacterium phosphatilyticum TaxID=475075 RepID=A0A316WR03_9FLAO|nr:hypothetical protein C1631_022160 [Chryseobacterium phosphatilyticum]